MTSTMFKNELEENQHEEAIKVLCQEYPERCQFIQKNYLDTLKPMIFDAQIRTYLSIFVTRKVKALL
ncbi:MAG: hypothetical protein U9Q61_11545 [Thermodesulfobacteriota bacterium]|nr:hypothetical protein [Thermodesulfobacteriota bacterium]